jgi:hypothetical protein
MKATSPGKKAITFISRRAIASIAGALTMSVLGFAAAPDLRAETPADQIKAAGAISLTTELLDKMERFMKAVSADPAAKAELAAIDKDPSTTPEAWGSIVSAKCPKVVAIFKASGLTPDEFGRGILALMAVGMSDDLSKSEDKTVQANAAFVAANRGRTDAIFNAFLMFGESSSPASTP